MVSNLKNCFEPPAGVLRFLNRRAGHFCMVPRCRRPRTICLSHPAKRWRRELVTPMSTEREKLVRDINGLKESVRLGWLETAAKPMTPAERLELRKSIDSLVTELNTLRIKLDRPPKAEA